MSKQVKIVVDAASRAKLAELEIFISDLHNMLDVVMTLADDLLAHRGSVTLDEGESTRLNFALGIAWQFSTKLREAYYSDAGAA